MGFCRPERALCCLEKDLLQPIPRPLRQTQGPLGSKEPSFIERGRFQANKGPSKAGKWPPGQHRAHSDRRKALLDRKIDSQADSRSYLANKRSFSKLGLQSHGLALHFFKLGLHVQPQKYINLHPCLYSCLAMTSYIRDVSNSRLC